MSGTLQPPVAIVTGGAGGIGSATAKLLASTGFQVAVFDLARPGRDLGQAISCHLVDITDEIAVNEAVHDVLARYGRLDAVINSAALLECYAAHETPVAVWNRMFDVNVKGSFLVCRAAIPALRRSERASIVNLSSVHAYASVPRTAAYAATKGAIISLSRQLAVEYAEDGIRVNAVVVGSVDTAMSTKHGAAVARDGIDLRPPPGRLGRMAQPAEVAAAIGYLVSEDASFVTGAAFQVDGGLLNHLM